MNFFILCFRQPFHFRQPFIHLAFSFAGFRELWRSHFLFSVTCSISVSHSSFGFSLAVFREPFHFREPSSFAI